MGITLGLQVQMVLEWTSAVGINLLAGVPGPKGLTALHLAAVMEDGAGLAALLTGKILPCRLRCYKHFASLCTHLCKVRSILHCLYDNNSVLPGNLAIQLTF